MRKLFLVFNFIVALSTAAAAQTIDVPQQRYVASTPWMLSQTPPANQGWTFSAWSPDLGIVAAVAESGTGNRVMTSPDMVKWTSKATPADVNWHCIVWSKVFKNFAAIATNVSGGTVRAMISVDGDYWPAMPTPNTDSWTALTEAPELGLLVAVSTGPTNYVMTSADGGRTWINQPAPAAAWAAVAWSPERHLLVAVGSGAVMTSPDAEHWTLGTPTEANNWHGVAWGAWAGKFVAVSLDGAHRVMTSTDGFAWVPQTAAAANQWRGVAAAPEIGLFIASGGTSSGNAIMTSPLGDNWTSSVTPLDNSWLHVTWSPQLGMALSLSYAGTGAQAMTSVSSHSYYYRSNNVASGALGSDIALNNTSAYFDGPSMSQGTTGTWFVTANITLVDSTMGAAFFCKLWDGTTTFTSGTIGTHAANGYAYMTLTGYRVAPTGNIRVSCRDVSSTTGKIIANTSGLGKDSTIYGVRVQ